MAQQSIHLESALCYRHFLLLTLLSQYWLWVPVIAPIVGAQIGTMFYDVFLYNGEDSIVNRRYVTR